MTITILVTRPEPSGSVFSAELSALMPEVRVMSSPISECQMVKATVDLEGVRFLIFTSKAGVDAFKRISDRRDIPTYAVGEATAQAARALGITTRASGGDAQALVAQMIAEQVAGPCLHLRGRHARGNVAGQLNQAGIETKDAVIYEQVAIPLSEEARAILAGKDPVILPLFSPRAAALVSAEIQEIAEPAPLFVVAMSAAVKDALRAISVKNCLIAEQPSQAAMTLAVQRLNDAAKRLEGGRGDV